MSAKQESHWSWGDPEFLVAVVVLIAFGILTWFLLHHSPSDGAHPTNSETWARYTYLYSGAQALFVGAAGLIFGARGGATRAAKAEAAAERSEKAGVAGRALKAAAQADKAAAEEAEDALSPALSATDPDKLKTEAAAQQARRFATLAEELFKGV